MAETEWDNWGYKPTYGAMTLSITGFWAHLAEIMMMTFLDLVFFLLFATSWRWQEPFFGFGCQ